MRVLNAVCMGDQITMGKLHFHHREYYGLSRESALPREQEERRYLWARDQAINELNALFAQADGELTRSEAEIFFIHTLLLMDDNFNRRILELIRSEDVTAQYAVHTVGRDLVHMFKELDDPYMQARATDIRDIMRRVILHLVHIHPDHTLNHRSTILVSKYFLPSEVMELDRSCILGIITTKDTMDSHTALMLNRLKIPAMSGVPLDPERDEGVTALMDGHAGRLYLEPTVELTEQLRRQYERGGCPAGV